MSAESARRFDALEAQAERLMATFGRAGYERVAPAILQPASIFLDRVGEDIRSRTYVFADPDGVELCLRPDLTIPVCRIHLDRHGAAPAAEARYSYNGPAFRYQRGAPDKLRPNEFRQAGVEYFGGTDALEADMETLGLTVAALREAGLAAFTLKIGDIGMFHALLAALDMPERWRKRLAEAFRRGDALAATLERLRAPAASGLDAETLDLALRLPADDEAEAARILARHLEARGAALFGARAPEEIAGRLVAIAADSREPPLGDDAARMIEAYLAISGSARAALDRIGELTAAAGRSLATPLDALALRLDRIAALAPAAGETLFAADLGRRFEYYCGFVFEIAAGGRAVPAPIASGGRYDGLAQALGAAAPVPATGAAIYTERLLGAVTREAA